jgi:SAM-dependent methyltransferase
MFDMVLMFDVLEHLANPAEGLLSALKLVKPGGRLIVSTADSDAWTWSQLGAQHWYLQTGQHLSVLSRNYIHYLERRHNLTIERIMRIPHTRSGPRVRFRKILELVHLANRKRPFPWRLLSRSLQEVPGFRAIRHRQTVPWAMSLQDHMFVVIRAGK